MPDIRDDLTGALSDPEPVRRAQIQMLKPLPKRFYTAVTVASSDNGGHAVLLDGRTVRTPAKNPLSVPTARVAALLAEEWDAQKDVIDPATMPVTRLANTALDGVAKDIRAVFEDILKFSGTDLLCYRASEPEGLVARQMEGWDPILAWAAESLGARFVLAEGIIHQEQPRAAVNAFANALRAYATPLGLACLHTITTLTGSAILALAFAEQRATAEETWAFAHVDEDWQIEHWGTDEEAFQRRELRWREMQAAAKTLDALR
ncbi:chaperone required for assembly of F1-ATPase [Pararhizobium capsulatum DSM 1112]|uniref:Chaperone required for assembly of F1-ATPase n=1 Tax=Pararhizobium capsulatum DSM 1112 TaxID=1121113 RepID=A0ABU0BP04_9HYPH|nr:ATP12 family chaperone protein [Pararhizobium capsulatum]MDQ0319975.1 chaperone required for assembly of F1-ATPase [Pararhizobium capsulatum DSM 1112]